VYEKAVHRILLIITVQNCGAPKVTADKIDAIKEETFDKKIIVRISPVNSR
jgi:hypothetical protein